MKKTSLLNYITYAVKMQALFCVFELAHPFLDCLAALRIFASFHHTAKIAYHFVLALNVAVAAAVIRTVVISAVIGAVVVECPRNSWESRKTAK